MAKKKSGIAHSKAFVAAIMITIIFVSAFLITQYHPLFVDSDGDGVPDTADIFPLDPSEWADTDGDGVGDNEDPDPFDPDIWGTNETMTLEVSITMQEDRFTITIAGCVSNWYYVTNIIESGYELNSIEYAAYRQFSVPQLEYDFDEDAWIDTGGVTLWETYTRVGSETDVQTYTISCIGMRGHTITFRVNGLDINNYAFQQMEVDIVIG
jgi:hypothetical protein